MSTDLYRFTINGNNVATMHELHDGYWIQDDFDSNQSASVDGSTGKVTIVEDNGAYQQVNVYAQEPGQDYYVAESSAYVDAQGNPIASQPGPMNDLNGDGFDDDDIDHDGFENDALVGTSGRDALFGRAGDDTISARSGNDFVHGGSGDDHLYGNDGRDVLIGAGGGDTLDGGAGKDILGGGSGSDGLFGGKGDDKLFGGAGNDSLYDGAGNDYAIGGSGNDVFYAGAGDDFYQGASGYDTVSYEYAQDGVVVDLQRGRAGSLNAGDAVADPAGIGKDHFHNIENAIGSDFNDVLIGSARSNALDGRAGDDVLFGGVGKDEMTGGQGDDVFRFNRLVDSKFGGGHDTITDFAAGDLVDLSGIDAIRGNHHGNDAFTFVAANDVSTANARGAVWFDDGMLYGSTDRDVHAEFKIELTGVHNLDANELVL